MDGVAENPAVDPAGMLGAAEAAARRTRAARPSRAVPFLVLALVVIAAMPFYVTKPWPAGDGSDSGWLPGLPSGPLAGFQDTSAGVWTSVYWLVGLPAGYAIITWWYARAGRRSGVMVSVRPLVLAGLGLFAVLLASFLLGAFPWPGDLLIRGLAPLITIAAGLLGWAIAGRSGLLAVAAVVFAGAALTADLYDVENVLYRFGRSSRRTTPC